MAATRKQLGQLTSLVVEPRGAIRKVVILCHGFGAPGDDLVPLGTQLQREFPLLGEHVQFVFPEAPLSLAEQGMPFGRAWWPLDMERLARAAATGEFRDQRRESPPQLATSQELLLEAINVLKSESGLSTGDIVLGGFSQGSMLATATTLQLAEAAREDREARPGGIVVWSGTLLNEDVWRRQATFLQGLPIVQSHGRQDQILPFQAAVWLKELFESGGADIEFLEFIGPHTISPEAYRAAGELILNLM